MFKCEVHYKLNILLLYLFYITLAEHWWRHSGNFTGDIVHHLELMIKKEETDLRSDKLTNIIVKLLLHEVHSFSVQVLKVHFVVLGQDIFFHT